jgi:transcriptional regulator with XRE-family HTH domain
MQKEKQLLQLGNRIRKLREEKMLSQTELANMMGKDQQSIQRIEKGRVNPSYLFLIEISSALKISVTDLLDF